MTDRICTASSRTGFASLSDKIILHTMLVALIRRAAIGTAALALGISVHSCIALLAREQITCGGPQIGACSWERSNACEHRQSLSYANLDSASFMQTTKPFSRYNGHALSKSIAVEMTSSICFVRDIRIKSGHKVWVEASWAQVCPMLGLLWRVGLCDSQECSRSLYLPSALAAWVSIGHIWHTPGT